MALSADTSDLRQQRQSDHWRPGLRVPPLRYSSSESGGVSSSIPIGDRAAVKPKVRRRCEPVWFPRDVAKGGGEELVVAAVHDGCRGSDQKHANQSQKSAHDP
jgi:hypothetical protein